MGTGYNGSAKGVINCYEVGCIKNELNLPQDGAYDYCPAVHAEENAIINSNRIDRIGAKLYIAGLTPSGNCTYSIPCQRCRRKIINSEIEEVVILNKKGKPRKFNVKNWVKEDSDWYLKQLNEIRRNSKITE